MEMTFNLFIYTLIAYIATYHLTYSTVNLLAQKNKLKVAMFNYAILFTLPLCVLLTNHGMLQVLFVALAALATAYVHPFHNNRKRTVVGSILNTAKITKKLWRASNVVQRGNMVFSAIAPMILGFIFVLTNFATGLVGMFAFVLGLLVLVLPMGTFMAIIMNELHLDNDSFLF